AFTLEYTSPELGLVGDIAVGPEGQVVAAWLNAAPEAYAAHDTSILAVTGLDGFSGPQSFGPTRTVKAGIPTFFPYPISAQDVRGVSADVKLAWDRSNGPHRGRLYVSYTNAVDPLDPKDTDIFVQYSDDNGLNWSQPVRVNDR